MSRRYEAVLFDLLTALLDSWSLWNTVAGGEQAGRRWRAAYLAITYRTGRYRRYEDLVADAAESVGLSRLLADELSARYGTIEPWPEAGDVLGRLHAAGVPLGVVTNCSEALGRLAASRIPIPFKVIVTAERAGCYKPEPQPYRRIRRDGSGFVLAVKDWRVRFSVQGASVSVHEIRSGYRASQLARASAEDPALVAHREFRRGRERNRP